MAVVPGAEGQLPRPVASPSVGTSQSASGSRRSPGRPSGRVTTTQRAVRATGAARSRSRRRYRSSGRGGTRHGSSGREIGQDDGDAPSLAGYHRPTMADQLSLRLEADRLPELPDLRPMLPRPLPSAVRLGRAPVRAVVGRRARARRRSGRPSSPGGGDGPRPSTRTGRDLYGAPSRSSPGWRSGSRRGRRSSTASWSWSTPPAGPTRPSSARRLAGEPGRPVGVPRLRPARTSTGDRCSSQPLVRRREALRRVLRPGDEVVAVPAIATEGVALFEAVVAQGIAGHPRPAADEPVPARRPQPAVALRGGDGRRRGARRDRRRSRRTRPSRGRGPGPGADQPAAAGRRGPLTGRRRLSRRRPAPPRRTPGCPAAARTAARRRRTSASPTTATTAIASDQQPDRQQRPPTARPPATMSRASITNGLNGGTNEAIVTHVPPAAAERDDRRSGSRPSPRG